MSRPAFPLDGFAKALRRGDFKTEGLGGIIRSGDRHGEWCSLREAETAVFMEQSDRFGAEWDRDNPWSSGDNSVTRSLERADYIGFRRLEEEYGDE